MQSWLALQYVPVGCLIFGCNAEAKRDCMLIPRGIAVWYFQCYFNPLIIFYDEPPIPSDCVSSSNFLYSEVAWIHVSNKVILVPCYWLWAAVFAFGYESESRLVGSLYALIVMPLILLDQSLPYLKQILPFLLYCRIFCKEMYFSQCLSLSCH